MTTPYVPPPYPYDRLDELRALAADLYGSAIDLSIGAPFDPPTDAVINAFSTSGAERGYPLSKGSVALREAAARWLDRRFGLTIGVDSIAACVGTKEFVAGVPHILRLQRPERDTVLYPEISYPTYEFGAVVAGCRDVPVPVDEHWRIDLSAIDPSDAARALCLWVNTPGNPAGGLDDLGAAAAWAREHDVPVFSDECYIEFTWQGEGRSILEHGDDRVVAVHSLSKRSNLAGARVGFYAGDNDLVRYLSAVRQHQGHGIPGPAQAAGIVALDDDAHVDVQRERYRNRLETMSSVIQSLGVDCPLPGGGFYLWVPAPDGDAWAFAERLARELGVIVSPGEFYGPAGSGHIRIAVVAGDEQFATVAERCRG